MSELERINPTEFAPVQQDEAEQVMGGLAEAADYCYSGTQTVIIDGRPRDLQEWSTDVWV